MKNSTSLCKSKQKVLSLKQDCQLNESIYVQKQPSRGVLRKRYSQKIPQIYRRTPMPKCDFNKVTKQLY